MSTPALRATAIVDDHELVSIALGPLIDATDGLTFAGRFATVDALLRADGVAPCLVVLDLVLRDGSRPGPNIMRLHQIGASVLVLTSSENRHLIREALEYDVLGVLRKSAPPDVILAAISAAGHDQPVASSPWRLDADTDLLHRAAPLTNRERQVLVLYALGAGAKSVATELHISENTVQDHIRRIRALYQRLGRPANTKVELYQRGLEDGFLPPPGSA